MVLLIDTNVFLELFLKREKYEVVKDFFNLCCIKKYRIYVTSMSLRDIEYMTSRIFHSSIIGRKFAYRAYEMSHKILPISPDSAINSFFNEIDDYEDGLIMEAGNEALVDALVTFNIKDFTKPKINVFTPEEIIKYSNCQ